ncbi:Prolyl endopeptidase FAP [Amphibalanus amphitrite]|uniref:Prolyl endopeptidase FAP n=1 Tax=Amphibalanus amphitrite TaxID=1232801 RepID=A0A6A4WPW3_AMPAM|nr:Prolyl endopeptidase FAP [Amphibalanus amphitrite]
MRTIYRETDLVSYSLLVRVAFDPSEPPGADGVAWSVDWPAYLASQRQTVVADVTLPVRSTGKWSPVSDTSALREVVEGLLSQLKFVDAQRVAIEGRGLGALLALRLLAQPASVVSCAVAIAPITSWHSYEAFVSGQKKRQEVEDVLTEQLFAVNNMLGSIQRHVKRLDDWEEAVGGLESRLDDLSAGEEAVSNQAADTLQRVEALSETSSAARSELGDVVAAQESTAQALVALRGNLIQSVAAVAESMSGLASSQASEHNETRSACGDIGGAALTEPLAELRTAVGRVTELAHRTEETLDDGLQRVDSRLQETGEQLTQLGQEVQDERQTRLTPTTPPPTVDPLQTFLDALKASLNEQKTSPPKSATPSMNYD